MATLCGWVLKSRKSVPTATELAIWDKKGVFPTFGRPARMIIWPLSIKPSIKGFRAGGLFLSVSFNETGLFFFFVTGQLLSSRATSRQLERCTTIRFRHIVDI